MIQMGVKYLLLLKIEFCKFKLFKVNFFSQIIFLPFKILILYLFWSQVYKLNSGAISGYTFQEIMYYYIQINALSFFIMPFGLATYEIYKDINTGNIDIFLTKPYSYLIKVFVTKGNNLIFGIPILILTNIFCMILLNLSLSLYSFLFQQLFIILSGVITFLLFAIVGSMSFFIKRTLGLRDIIWAIIKLFSGALIPLEFYGQLSIINEFLPFKYIYYVPSSLFRYESIDNVNMIVTLLVGCLWSLILGMILKYVFNKGITSREGLGG